MGQPDLSGMYTSRAIGFVEQHTLSCLPDQQARKDWLQEIEMVYDFPSEIVAQIVQSGAAVDEVDAVDILRTEALAATQPHRAEKLREDLAGRRGPRMRARILV